MSSGTVHRWYELVEHRINFMGQPVNMLTRNRDKAVEYYKNGGTVKTGYMKEYARGRRYPYGNWETFVSTGKGE